jgi:hypothetical protein
MTLNDRERFILHTMSVMVVDIMVKKFKYETNSFKDMVELTTEQLIDTMNDIGKGRCRKLSRVDISNLYEEINEEMMLGVEVHRQ